MIGDWITGKRIIIPEERSWVEDWKRSASLNFGESKPEAEAETESNEYSDKTREVTGDKLALSRRGSWSAQVRPAYSISAKLAKRLMDVQRGALNAPDAPADNILVLRLPDARNRRRSELLSAQEAAAGAGRRQLATRSGGGAGSGDVSVGGGDADSPLANNQTLVSNELSAVVSNDDSSTTLDCTIRLYTFKAVKSDSSGNRCWGSVVARICYGACDTGEIADWLFPHKKSIHKVCMHGARFRRRVMLESCNSAQVDPSLREYHYEDARTCVCQKCSSADSTCLGSLTRPYLSTDSQTQTLIQTHENQNSAPLASSSAASNEAELSSLLKAAYDTNI